MPKVRPRRVLADHRDNTFSSVWFKRSFHQHNARTVRNTRKRTLRNKRNKRKKSTQETQLSNDQNATSQLSALRPFRQFFVRATSVALHTLRALRWMEAIFTLYGLLFNGTGWSRHCR